VLLTFGLRPELFSLFANVSVGIFLLAIRYISPLRRNSMAFRRRALLVSKFQDRNSLSYTSAPKLKRLEIISAARGYEFHWSPAEWRDERY
jgi:hypothetical protein